MAAYRICRVLEIFGKPEGICGATLLRNNSLFLARGTGRMCAMNYRERVIGTMQFQAVDSLPFRHAYGLMPGVLEEWHAQGLPARVQTEQDIYLHFGFQTRSTPLPVNVGPRPSFAVRVIEETAEYKIATDGLGRITKVLKEYASLPLPMNYPVNDWASWKAFKPRLSFSPDRVGAELENVMAENMATGHLNSFGTTGFYWFPRDLMGDESLCVAYYEQPDLVYDILETWCALIEQTLDAVLRRVKLDEIHFGEDMAYKNASMVSPAIFKEFLKPYYDRIHTLVRRYEVPIFSVDTDGNVNELIGWFAGCGVNRIGPNEVNAGNDLVAYRKRFGRTMGYDGGLDKRIMLQGRDAIDAMLERTIPFMKETGGGWIISLDHRVLKGTSLADFRHYVDRGRTMAAF